MPTSYTPLLGLALPVTGELDGTWGDTVNDSITSLLDDSVAGTTTLSSDADVTLSTTTGASNQARAAIIRWTASGSVTRNITAPAQSKAYVVINATGGTQSIVIRGVGPTTGVTVPAGTYALVAWNGSDFVRVGGDVTLTGTQTLTNKTISADSNTLSGIAASSFVLSNASGNIDGSAAQKAIPSGVVVGTTDTQTLTNKTLSTGSTWSGNTIGVAAGGTGATTLTGIVKGNGTSAFTAATAGTDYAVGGSATSWTADQTFNSSAAKIKGSSTGTTAIASANSSATNYTLTLPAVTSTVLTKNDYSSGLSTLVANSANTPVVLTAAANQSIRVNSGGTAWEAYTPSTGSGSVSSVGLTMPSGFTVSGSPVTSSGTLAVSTTLSGVLKGTGSGITAATAGTDYAVGGTATSWTADQTFNSSSAKIKGSSTGVTSIASANASATNYTITFPASTGTVLTTATAVTVAQGGTGATTLTGLLKGNGTSAFTAAVSGTDYQAPIGTISGIAKGNGANALTAATANTDYLAPALANTAVSGFKTATFNSQTTIATTTGAITVDWTTAQNQKQTEPTGTITYTFTAPPGPCHCQLLIDSDGTSTAQTINWPGSVIWMGTTWAGVNNKKAVINFWYDGTNYIAIGSNQV